MNTNTPEQGDPASHGEPGVSAEDLDSRIASEPEDPDVAIGTHEVHEDTTLRIRRHLDEENQRAAAAAAANHEPEPEPEPVPVTVADSDDGADEVDDDSDEPVDPMGDYVPLPRKTMEVGLSGVAAARQAFEQATSKASPDASEEDDEA